MADLQIEPPIEPPDEPEQESLSVTILLRCGAAFLCALFGLISALLGYGLALFIDLDLENFNTHTSVYFSITLVLWILIGSTTPFAYFTRIFETFKGMTVLRAVVFILVIGTFVMVHWYMLSFATELFVSVFGGD